MVKYTDTRYIYFPLSYRNHAPTHIGRGNYCSYLSLPLLIATAPGDDIALPNTSFTSQIKNTITSTGIRHVVTISTASPSMNLLTMFFTLSAVTDNVFFTLFTASFALSIKPVSYTHLTLPTNSRV